MGSQAFRKKYSAEVSAAEGGTADSDYGTAGKLVAQVVANYRTAVELGRKDEARQWLSLGTLLGGNQRQLMALFRTKRVALRFVWWDHRASVSLAAFDGPTFVMVRSLLPSQARAEGCGEGRAWS